MLVISDTSPVRALVFLGLIDLLPALYGKIVIPPAVAQELGSGMMSVDVASYPFIQVVQPATILPLDLDKGESEAITLARELKADLLLIDEREGTNVAKGLGIRTVGVIGVLLQGKGANRIEEVGPLLKRLKNEGGFFLSSELIEHVLRLAGELS